MEIILSSGGRLGGPPEMIRRFLIQGARLVNIPERNPVPVTEDRKIRVLAVVHGWFPALAAGSERMLQHMLDALPKEEFDVRIWHFGVGEEFPTNEVDYIHEGLLVRRNLNPDPSFVPDVIITHHGYAARVVPTLYERWPNAFVVAVYHNDRFDIPDINRVNADLNVYNTQWVKKSLGGKGIVLRPPLEPARHSVDQTGNSITLVNLQENKGVRLFRELAERRPQFEFTGVLGTHGDQETWFTPNVDVVPTTQDMRDVWKHTKIVLMPSEYESYGMVAAEACVNGIPVIAHPTPGLVECLDEAGLFIDRNDVDGYERTIHLLMTDPEHYRERSERARIRANELVMQSDRELKKFTNRLRKMVKDGTRTTRS